MACCTENVVDGSSLVIQNRVQCTVVVVCRTVFDLGLGEWHLSWFLSHYCGYNYFKSIRASRQAIKHCL